MDAVLLLHDVLVALQASPVQMAEILGDDACRYVKHQLDGTGLSGDERVRDYDGGEGWQRFPAEASASGRGL